jgi:hypothetical protein
MGSAWTSFRSLEGWQRRSLGSATFAMTFFLAYRLPAFINGDRSVSWSELDGDLAGTFGICLWALVMWDSYAVYQRTAFANDEGKPARASRFERGFLGMYVAAEAFADSLNWLLTRVRHLIIRLLRRIRRHSSVPSKSANDDRRIELVDCVVVDSEVAKHCPRLVSNHPPLDRSNLY